MKWVAHTPAPKTVARPEQPQKGPVFLRVIGANEKSHGYRGSGKANQCGEKDEPEIMLFGKTAINALYRSTFVASNRGSGAAPDSGNCSTMNLISRRLPGKKCHTGLAFCYFGIRKF